MIDNKRAMRLSDENYQIILRNVREQREFWEMAIARYERKKATKPPDPDPKVEAPDFDIVSEGGWGDHE